MILAIIINDVEKGGEWSDEQNCCDSTSVYSYKMWDYYAVLYPDDVCYCVDNR